MNRAYGVALIVAGACLAAYLGLYVLFYGGIVDLVNAVQTKPVVAKPVAIGIIKIVCASVGAIPGYVLILFGWATVWNDD